MTASKWLFFMTFSSWKNQLFCCQFVRAILQILLGTIRCSANFILTKWAVLQIFQTKIVALQIFQILQTKIELFWKFKFSHYIFFPKLAVLQSENDQKSSCSTKQIFFMAERSVLLLNLKHKYIRLLFLWNRHVLQL